MNIRILTTINELISTLSYAMDVEQRGKQYHGWRTAVLVATLTDIMDLERRRELFYAALLHDIGGIGSDHFDLHQFREVSDEMPDEIIGHSDISARIVEKIPGLSSMRQPLKEHHEHWDGSGYPRGLKQAELTLEGQILGLADHLDVIFRGDEEFTRDSIITRIRNFSGRLFSPYLIDHATTTFSMIHPGQLINTLDLTLLPETFSICKDMVGAVVVPEEPAILDKALNIFAEVIDTKHSYTRGHSRRVAEYATCIARELGIGGEPLVTLRWAGLLHDIGKLCVPIDILDKTSSLSDQEYQTVKHHAYYSYELIKKITDLRPIALAAAAHHERLDGRGYPFGLNEAAIPFEAKILCVADAFDALTSGRPYQKPLTQEEISSIFERNIGKQFDGQIVNAGLPVLFGRLTGYASRILAM